MGLIMLGPFSELLRLNDRLDEQSPVSVLLSSARDACQPAAATATWLAAWRRLGFLRCETMDRD